MGDEYGDDPMAMGVDSSGQPVHHWGSDEVGAIPGIHGIHAADVPAHENPDGTPLPDAVVPPAPDQNASTSWLGDVLHEGYRALTTPPDPTTSQPNPVTEQADHQRQVDEEMDREATGRHMLPAPEQHF